jgi:hypothetical protein
MQQAGTVAQGEIFARLGHNGISPGIAARPAKNREALERFQKKCGWWLN